MKVSVTFHVSDMARRGINWNRGRPGLATRADIQNAIGATVDVWLDDMAQEGYEADSESEESGAEDD